MLSNNLSFQDITSKNLMLFQRFFLKVIFSYTFVNIYCLFFEIQLILVYGFAFSYLNPKDKCKKKSYYKTVKEKNIFDRMNEILSVNFE